MDKPVEIAVWVGMDWADEQHVFALRTAESGAGETGAIVQKPEDLDAWVNGLRERAGGGLVAVAVEQSRGALVYALMDYEFVLIYPVNPKSLASYRKAFYPSGGKNDPSDAALILDYLLKHRERLRLWQPDSPEIRVSADGERAATQAGELAHGADQSTHWRTSRTIIRRRWNGPGR